MENESDNIDIYAIIKPSQKIVGNKHITYLRNFLYNILKIINEIIIIIKRIRS